MFFIGIALAIAIALGLLISADAGTLVGLTQQQFGQLVPLLILLVIFAGGAFARRRKMLELLGNLAIWIAIFGVALIGYTYRADINGIAARVFGEIVPGTASIDSANHTATFRSGRDGHFQINAEVNGAGVAMLFDTGASTVVLTGEDARKAGIDTKTLKFDIPVSTANGTGRAASIVLDRIEVGGILRTHIRAFVAAPGALETSLLGMSFLETLRHYGVAGNQLELAD